MAKTDHHPHDRSAARGLYVFKHDSELGYAPVHVLFQLLAQLPERWVVDCEAVGDGQAALRYLGRYLCRGVISERDILRCKDGLVTFRYRDARTGKSATRTLPGADFLWLLRHVLPKGFVRARNFGFLHHNSRRALQCLQLLHLRPSAAQTAQPPETDPTQRPVWRCACGGVMVMVMVRRRIRPQAVPPGASPQTERPDKAEPVEVTQH